jgi:hypothetical protein
MNTSVSEQGPCGQKCCGHRGYALGGSHRWADTFAAFGLVPPPVAWDSRSPEERDHAGIETGRHERAPRHGSS